MADEYISGEQHRAQQQDSRPKRGGSKTIVLGLIVLVVAAALILGGMQYQKSHQSASVAVGTSGGFGSGRRRGFGGHRPVLGQVTTVSSSSISITEQSGTVATFSLTGSTTFMDNGQTLTISDITTGETVAIIASSTNSTQASRILVNPSFGGGAAARSGAVSN